MNKIYKVLSLLMVTAMYAGISKAQVTVFTDDFNRAAVSPGGTPSATYTTSNGIATYSGVQIGGTDAWSNVAFTSGQLASWIDGSGAFTTVNTYAQTTGALSSFAAPYNTTLSSNLGMITWTFNIRSSANATGFAANQNNAMVVLAGNAAAVQNTGSGYGVTFNPSTPAAIELVRYNGGITGVVTQIISSTALLASGTRYASVRVTYVPSTNTWSLYVRDDGATAFADPSTGVTTLGGTAVNATYTGLAMSVFGFYANYSSTSTASSGNTNYAYFDNFTVNEACGLPANAGVTTACPGTTTTLSNTVTGGTWTSSNTGVATIGSGSGLVTGVSAGTAVMTYTMPYGCTSVTTVTINSNPGPITGSLTVCAGSNTPLANITSGGTWSSANTSTATVVSGTGVVTGVASGVTTITYKLTATGCYSTATLLVQPIPAAITGTATVCAAYTTTLSDPSPGGTWSTASPEATIGVSTGIVTGVTSGFATVTYTLPTGCYNTRVVTVNPLPVTISGSNVVCKALTTALTDASTGGTWSSLNTSIATIGASSGIVTGINGGITLITYTLPTGCYIVTNMKVNVPPAAATGPNVVCQASSITLTNTVSGGSWTSAAPSSATVGSSTGTVTGVGPGIDTIFYTITACPAEPYIVTVNPLPSIISGFTQVCEGSTTALTDSTFGGTWSVSGGTAGIASVTTSGSLSTAVISGITGGAPSLVSYTLPTGCRRVVTVTVDVLPTPITGQDSVCQGASVTLSNATTGGLWTSADATIAAATATTGIVTGVNPGTVSISYSLITGCRREIIFKVINPLPAAVIITDTPTASPLCEGSPVTFTAHPTNGGTPTYEWRVFGTTMGTGPTFTYTPAHGDYVTVYMTIGNICAAPAISSNSMTMSVYPNATPSISIRTDYNPYASFPTNPCAPVTGVRITPIAGTTDTVIVSWNPAAGSTGYEWALTTSPNIPASGTLVADTTFSVKVSGLAGSNPYYAVVRNRCSSSSNSDWASNVLLIEYSGQVVTFFSDVTFGGASPSYQWYRNGTIIPGATNISYSTPVYYNDTIRCDLTATTAPCQSTNTAGSNSIIVMPSPLGVSTIGGSDNGFSIFPNPNNGTFTIKGTGIRSASVSFEVSDMLGNIVHTGSAPVRSGEVSEQVNLAQGLATGTYMLRITTDTDHHTYHFTKSN